MSYAKSVRNVSTFEERWRTQRINRRLDDRDNAMKDAIKLLEAKSSDYFPVLSSTNLILDANSATVGTVSGTSFTHSDVAWSTGSVTTDGDACTLTVHLPGEVEFTLTLTMDNGSDSFTPTYSSGVLTSAELGVNGTTVTALTAAIAATQCAHLLSVTAGTGADTVETQDVTVSGGSSWGDYEVSIGGVAYWPFNETLSSADSDPSDDAAYGITAKLTATALAINSPTATWSAGSAYNVRCTFDGVLCEMWLRAQA